MVCGRSLARGWLVLVVGHAACTADATVASGEPPVPPGVDHDRAVTESAPSTVAAAVAPATVSPPPPTATVDTKPVIDEQRPAAAVAAEEVPFEKTCAATVDDLPESTLVNREDRRLRRGALLVVSKATRRLMRFDEGRLTHCFPVGLGFAPKGHKAVQGDGRTPEGWYRTSDKPWSSFDNAIAIHYPNEADAIAAADDGRIGAKTRERIVSDLKAGKVPPQATKLGGAVLIHGGGASADWTLGCVALEDTDLVALRAVLPRGMRTDLLVMP